MPFGQIESQLGLKIVSWLSVTIEKYQVHSGKDIFYGFGKPLRLHPEQQD